MQHMQLEEEITSFRDVIGSIPGRCWCEIDSTVKIPLDIQVVSE